MAEYLTLNMEHYSYLQFFRINEIEKEKKQV